MKELTEDVIKKLKKILIKVYEDDQKYRKKSKETLDKYGSNSKEVEEILKDMARLDKINLERIEVILKEYGWLGENTVGFKESEAIFLVIAHASLDIQLKYYQVMEKAVKEGKARICDLASLEDRTLVKQGKKQIYGTQLIYDEKEGVYIVEPLVYPEKVDERRESVGLPPMNEYLEYYGLEWKNGTSIKK